MAYNSLTHHRRSIRLKGYDYSQAGLYFVTICCQDRAHLFGHIVDGEMQLNDAGIMVQKWYDELEQKFPDIIGHEMIVMPNHFHCIIENTGLISANGNVRADLCVRPLRPDADALRPDAPILGERLPILGEHIGSPLHRVIQWFKTMSTNEYIRGVKTLGWASFNGRVWQRNYYEHIIRN